MQKNRVLATQYAARAGQPCAGYTVCSSTCAFCTLLETASLVLATQYAARAGQPCAGYTVCSSTCAFCTLLEPASLVLATQYAAAPVLSVRC